MTSTSVALDFGGVLVAPDDEVVVRLKDSTAALRRRVIGWNSEGRLYLATIPVPGDQVRVSSHVPEDFASLRPAARDVRSRSRM
jgi:hypothetical protein